MSWLKTKLMLLMISVNVKVGNIVRKRENTQYFVFILQCFQKRSFLGLRKSELYDKGLRRCMKKLEFNLLNRNQICTIK